MSTLGPRTALKSRKISGSLAYILAQTNVKQGTKAATNDVAGCTLEMGADGKWVGTLGSLSKATADALYSSGALANLATGATYRGTSGTQYAYSNGAGWVCTSDIGPGSPSTPFTTEAERTAWATANLSTLRSGVSTVWGPGGQWVFDGPEGDKWSADPVAVTTGRRVGVFGNSIMRQGASVVDSCTPTVANQGWLPSNSYSLDHQIPPTLVDLTSGYVAKYPKITTAGISGTKEPLWYLYAPGETVQDGTAIWTMQVTTSTWNRFPGFWTWALQISGQPLIETFLGGVGGVESPEVITNVYDAIDNGVELDVFVFGPCWENDYGRTRALATIQSRWSAWVAMLDDLRSRGKIVAIQTPLPVKVDNTSGYVRGDGSKAYEWLIRKHREFASTRSDVILVECSDIYINPNPANPVWPDQTTTYTNNDGTTSLAAADGTHPGLAMHYRMAKRWAAAIAKRWAPRNLYGEAGEAGQVEPNPRHYGTSGTLTNATGVVSNLHRCVGISNATAVASIVTGSTGGKANRLVVTSAAAGAAYVAYKHINTVPLGGFTVRDLVQFTARVLVKANPVGFAKLGAAMTFVGSDGTVTVALDTLGATAQELSGQIIEDTVFDLLSLPVNIPASTTGFNLELDVYVHTTLAAVTVEVMELSIHRPEPLPLDV